MTPEEFKLIMQEYASFNNGDPEASHALADKLMCKVLKDLGYNEGVEIFENMTTHCA